MPTSYQLPEALEARLNLLELRLKSRAFSLDCDGALFQGARSSLGLDDFPADLLGLAPQVPKQAAGAIDLRFAQGMLCPGSCQFGAQLLLARQDGLVLGAERHDFALNDAQSLRARLTILERLPQFLSGQDHLLLGLNPGAGEISALLVQL